MNQKLRRQINILNSQLQRTHKECSYLLTIWMYHVIKVLSFQMWSDSLSNICKWFWELHIIECQVFDNVSTVVTYMAKYYPLLKRGYTQAQCQLCHYSPTTALLSLLSLHNLLAILHTFKLKIPILVTSSLKLHVSMVWCPHISWIFQTFERCCQSLKPQDDRQPLLNL
jgi:hypothetical protein